MDTDTIKKIIKYGTYAPSGDNSQPWKFVITNNKKILIYIRPEKDNPILNVHSGGSYLSSGAVIENIRIASFCFGYELSVEYFPDNNDDTLVSELSFKSINNTNNKKRNGKWLEIIKERSTNRKLYSSTIGKKTLDYLYEIKDKLNTDSCKILYISNQKDKNLIAKELSLSEQIILETEELHKLLYKDVVWTKKKELIKRHGLFVKTLEFNPIQTLIFWFCRKWSFISRLNRIGFSKFVAKQNEKTYKHSGLIGFLIIKETRPSDYLHAGEIMQNIWLNSTKFNLSFQPVTGIFFLNEAINEQKGKSPISNFNCKLINSSYNKLSDLLKLQPSENILLSFRIGESKRTKNRSSRLPANIILK